MIGSYRKEGQFVSHNAYDYREDIKRAVSVQDAVLRYASGVNIRHGRIPCPFHNGKDDNLSIYRADDGCERYYCFVCHASGDVIKFVQDMYGGNLSFNDAAQMLNEDFMLGLPLKKEESKSYKEKTDWRKAYDEFLEKRAKAEQEKFEREESYWTWFTAYVYAEKILERERPKCPEDGFSEDFVWALKNIEYFKYRMDGYS